jgi:hypothetical protein
MRRQLILSLATCVLFLVAGCSEPSAAPASAAVGQRAAQYAIQARKPEGGFVEVGRLVLRPTGQGQLTVTASGPEAERLRAAWTEISRRPSLATKARAADGMLVGRDVMRGAPEYGNAVADVMSREFGYFLSEIPSGP